LSQLTSPTANLPSLESGKARDGIRQVHKKTADLPGGLSGKPLQVLLPLAENTLIIFILSDLSIDNLRPKVSLRMAEARMRPNNQEQAFFVRSPTLLD